VPEIKEMIKTLDINKTEGTIIAQLNSSKQIQVLEQLKKKPGANVKEALQEITNLQKIEERNKKIEEIKLKIDNDFETQIEKKYQAIVIDPPWSYRAKSGNLNSEDYDPVTRRCSSPYPEMALSQIQNIQLPAADDCALFLWTTHAFIKDAFNLMENWGFDYKYTLVWDKELMGLGIDMRLQCEFCLLGYKGKPTVRKGIERDIIREKRREHSHKPNEIYDLVDRFVVGKKLDYFSREKRKGWDSYGVECEKFSNISESIAD
jgi:N6-adenosine-specific RNA methylase IME4